MLKPGVNGGFLEVADLDMTFEPLLAALSHAHDGWPGGHPHRSLSALFDYAGTDN